MQNLAHFMQTQKTLREMLSALEIGGHTAHLVGGSVRDVLLGRPSKDLDIATSAHPAQVAEIFRDKRFSVHETGIEHGTLTVVADNIPFEITTWRHDVSTDGRRATISFADSLEDDAWRRDFTINALYADRSGVVLDPTGQGLSDIRDRRVRFIGQAEIRIREDHLRILRFFRFNATLGANIDRNSVDFEECTRAAASTSTLPAERIGAEILKLLAQRAPAEAMEALVASGVTQHALENFPQNAKAVGELLSSLQIREAETGLAPDPIRRLALLVSDVPDRELRLSKAQCKSFKALRWTLENSAGLAEVAYVQGAPAALSAAALRAAQVNRFVSGSDLDLIEWAAGQVLPIKPVDLMPDFQGPALGAALRRAERLWIDTNFQTSREQLLQHIGQPEPIKEKVIS